MTAELLDRLPPQADEAEIKLLAAVVREGEQFFGRILAKVQLTPEEFRNPLHGGIWSIFLELAGSRTPFDSDVVGRAVKARGLNVGEAASALYEGDRLLGAALHSAYYAAQVREAHQRRSIIRAAEQMLRDAWYEGATVEDILSQCETTIREVKTGKYNSDPVPMETAMQAALDLVDEMLVKGTKLGVPSGFPLFDQEIGGFFKGELTILAARTSIGKTSLAMQYAHYAASTGRRVYYATLEMSHVEVALKLLCCLSGVSLASIRTGTASREDASRMVDDAVSASRLPLCLHDWPSLRTYDIRRGARNFNADLIVVDYLTLLTPADGKQKRYEQVGRLTKDLKAIARELQVPVIALAQLNRETDKQGKDCRPKLIHLREAGDIEQDADSVLLLYRVKGKPFQIKSEVGMVIESWDAELELAKGRLGRSHAVYRLDWDQRQQQYIEHGAARSIAANNPARNDFAAYGGNNGEF